jgi:hypothetical protein
MRITRKPLLTEMLWSLYRNRASKDVYTREKERLIGVKKQKKMEEKKVFIT